MWVRVLSEVVPRARVGIAHPVLGLSEINEFEFQNIASGEAWAWKSRLLKKDLLNVVNLCRLHKKMFGSTWRWAGGIWKWTICKIGNKFTYRTTWRKAIYLGSVVKR